MPESSRQWFDRPAAEGKRWVTDKNSKFPVEQPIPAPTAKELEEQERQWSADELTATDFMMLPDSPYTESERELIETYRSALRNPARKDTDSFPDASWRPIWPEGIKRDGV